MADVAPEVFEELMRVVYRASFGREIGDDKALYDSILAGRREAAEGIALAILAAGWVKIDTEAPENCLNPNRHEGTGSWINGVCSRCPVELGVDWFQG